MEEKIESFIDRGLENIAPGLYLFSIVGGILLIIIGFVLMIKSKTVPNDKMKIIGIISIGIGFLAFFSGLIQYVL